MRRTLLESLTSRPLTEPPPVADDAALAELAASVVRAAKTAGRWIAVVELTAESVSPAALQPRFPAVLVLGGESSGVSHDVLACADQAVAIPMLGMANSLNVATAGAIMLYEMMRRCAQSRDEPGG